MDWKKLDIAAIRHDILFLACRMDTVTFIAHVMHIVKLIALDLIVLP